MAVLTVQSMTEQGLTPAFVAADVAGDSFANDGKTYLHVKNADAADITVTVDSQKQCDQGFDHDIVVTIPAGGEKLIGPFNISRFKDLATGLVNVSYSVVTNVTVAAIKLAG